MGMIEAEIDLSEVEQLRPELTAYCYRMLGSIFEADDAVQDTFIRVWQKQDRFRQESSLRYWVYRIATNVCLDKLRSTKRRALPMDLADATSPIRVPEETLPLTEWVWPAPNDLADPAETVVRRDTIRLAFIAALQTLSPRQRAVLILHDVFRWSAKQTAAAMETTVAAVNSALQRARRALDHANLHSDTMRDTDNAADQQLLDHYLDAFERYDIDALLALFHKDASLSMPPFIMWVRGQENLASFYEATRGHCLGSRLLPVVINGDTPAFAQYAPSGQDGELVPWGIHALEMKDGKIAHIHTFIDAALYDRFGLPATLTAEGR